MIKTDIQQLDAGAVLEFYVLDATALGGTITRFHSGTNQLNASIVWQGNTYQPFPVEATGFEVTAQGVMPRPKLRMSNVGGLIGALVRDYQDLVGAKVTRRRTLKKYLDAVNFPGGVNPTADPTAEFPLDVYFVDRKAVENKQLIEFELGSAFDVEGVKVPRRQIIQNTCPWIYRSADCGYAGGPVATELDAATSDPTLDKCGKRLASCRMRFGTYGELPYGGFPGAGVQR